MKKECLICGKEFEALNGAKRCPECRTAHKKATPTKRICEICEKEFEAVGKVKSCPTCRKLEAYRLTERACEKGENQIPKDQQRLVNAVQAARARGVSYGQYSAMRRGLLKV